MSAARNPPPTQFFLNLTSQNSPTFSRPSPHSPHPFLGRDTRHKQGVPQSGETHAQAALRNLAARTGIVDVAATVQLVGTTPVSSASYPFTPRDGGPTVEKTAKMYLATTSRSSCWEDLGFGKRDIATQQLRWVTEDEVLVGATVSFSAPNHREGVLAAFKRFRESGSGRGGPGGK